MLEIEECNIIIFAIFDAFNGNSSKRVQLIAILLYNCFVHVKPMAIFDMLSNEVHDMLSKCRMG